MQQIWRYTAIGEDANIPAGSGDTKGVAIREFPLNNGFGFADYLLYINGKACGVIEAKKEGATLTGVEVQSGRYAQGLPTTLPVWRRPLPFMWESNGVETHFTNGLAPGSIGHNPTVLIASFDIVVIEEACGCIDNLWRQVREYFKAYLIGLTATPKSHLGNVVLGFDARVLKQSFVS
ncbi:MAG: type I restriction endonuclease [Rhodoferax sp.]|nr:type I restriction endonuclease [Rhodoferax sp.]